MGLYDRDYMREQRPVGPSMAVSMRMWSINKWLIVLCIAVYVLDTVLLAMGMGGRVGMIRMGLLKYWGHFSAATTIDGWQLWRLITFQFLHGDMFHLLFNMIALYFFGPMIESYLGSRRYLAFYLLCGVAGPLAYMLMFWAGWIVTVSWMPMVGASAGIFGVLIAGARLAPNATVMLIFPPIPMRLQTLAWVLLGIAVLTILGEGRNAGGQAAHIGGAALGFVLIRNPHWLNVFDRGRSSMRFRR